MTIGGLESKQKEDSIPTPLLPEPSIIIPGPARWLAAPGRPSTLTVINTPLAIRHALARYMHRETGLTAHVMESYTREAAQLHMALWRDIVEKRNVTTFPVFWPLGAENKGLDWELSYLVNRILDGSLDPECVELLVERGSNTVTDDGSTETIESINEEHNRTRYYEDLRDSGCVIRGWSTLSSLRGAAKNAALRHAARHALEVRRVDAVALPPFCSACGDSGCGRCGSAS